MTSRNRFFWFVYALAYDRAWDSPLTARLAAFVSATMPGAGTVVDLGGGTGLMTAGYPTRTITVDTSPAMLRRAAAHGRTRETVSAAAEDTGLPDGSAAAVLICNVLHLHDNPATVVEEAHRLCKAGTVTYTWPVDGVTTAGIRRIDRSTRRGITASIVADLLRRAIGVFATVHGLTRQPHDTIHDAALNGCTCTVIVDETFLDCQHVLTIQRDTACHLPVRT